MKRKFKKTYMACCQRLGTEVAKDKTKDWRACRLVWLIRGWSNREQFHRENNRIEGRSGRGVEGTRRVNRDIVREEKIVYSFEGARIIINVVEFLEMWKSNVDGNWAISISILSCCILVRWLLAGVNCWKHCRGMEVRKEIQGWIRRNEGCIKHSNRQEKPAQIADLIFLDAAACAFVWVYVSIFGCL